MESIPEEEYEHRNSLENSFRESDSSGGQEGRKNRSMRYKGRLVVGQTLNPRECKRGANGRLSGGRNRFGP